MELRKTSGAQGCLALQVFQRITVTPAGADTPLLRHTCLATRILRDCCSTTESRFAQAVAEGTVVLGAVHTLRPRHVSAQRTSYFRYLRPTNIPGGNLFQWVISLIVKN